MSFKATYFNGTSARPYLAEVSITAEELLLLVQVSPEESNAISWPHSAISRTDISEKKIILKHGSQFPFETLEIDDEGFWDDLQLTAPEAGYIKSAYRSFKSGGNKAIALGLAGVVLFAVFAYFVLIPAVMVGAATVFPKDIEVQMGKSMIASLLAKENIDTIRTEEINKFYQQLQVDTEYDIHITVVESEIQNAFAVPGGQIVVFSAILDSMETHEQLVALLGHEVGHIEKRHTLKLLFKSLANYIIISAIFQDVSGLMAVVIDNASTIEQLSYNREVEAESDDFGFQVMQKNNINPQGMIDLFEQLNSTGHDDVIPAFLSSHPKLTERITDIKKRIKGADFAPSENDSLNYYWNRLRPAKQW